ncbi:MAG: tripartite tricarboxylate transporter TctB family protein [Spirochaetia bacterium]|nr:tripartite tricarboxylate transporter TctB family protein [Spirochaetia bacterium]
MSKVDLGTGIGIMALSVAVFFIAGKMPDARIGIGPGEYPMVVAGVLFVLGLALSLQNMPWKSKAGYPAKDSGGKPISLQMIKRPFFMAIVVFAYIRGMFYLGFLLLTPLFLFFAIWFFGYRRYLKGVAISLVTTAIIYVVFYYGFQVLLPRFILF